MPKEETNSRINLDNKQCSYLNIYIPFSVELKNSEEDSIKRTTCKTKLLISSVANNIESHVANYCLYNVGEEEPNKESLLEETYGKKIDLRLSIKNEKEEIINRIESIISNHIENDTKIKTNKSKTFVENIEFSIFNDSKYKRVCFLKVRFRTNYLKKCNQEDKINTVNDIYDVISRNVKQNFDESEDFNFGFTYKDLSESFNSISIEYIDGKKYKLSVEEEDWLFNYKDKDRRCYSFAYITENDEINHYCRVNKESTIRANLYRLSRIHEKGAIRTYNKNNDIFKLYKDDTSVIWGVSRVGLGCIAVQNKENELNRNIKVLNSDFSMLYEFSLHQKFYYYLMLHNNQNVGANFINRIILNNYVLKKENFYHYVEIFCPKIVSEFETQEIYDEIREKLEISSLLQDTEAHLDVLETKRSISLNKRNAVITLLLSTLVFPITIYDYLIKAQLVASVWQVKTILFLSASGFVLWVLYYLLTGKTNN